MAISNLVASINFFKLLTRKLNSFHEVKKNYKGYNDSGPIVATKDYSFDDWQEHGLDRNSVVANPMFIDPDNGDFRVKPDSPALKLGFKNFDMDNVGLLPDFTDKWDK